LAGVPKSVWLEYIGIPYFIVVEEQEFSQYASVIDKKKILVLDKRYQRSYETCDDLGDTKSLGPGPARGLREALPSTLKD
jgi:hypothetical protein